MESFIDSTTKDKAWEPMTVPHNRSGKDIRTQASCKQSRVAILYSAHHSLSHLLGTQSFSLDRADRELKLIAPKPSFQKEGCDWIQLLSNM